MRTIKFRAWNNTQKIMQEVLELEWVWNEDEEKRTKLDIITANGRIGDKLILMQFTGLHDKNGKEIYEGDIVRHNGLIKENPLYISFLDGAFCIGKDNIREFELSSHVTIRDAISMGKLYNMELELEVMGNIYENPELLNQ